jgi:hypothetical protein
VRALAAEEITTEFRTRSDKPWAELKTGSQALFSSRLDQCRTPIETGVLGIMHETDRAFKNARILSGGEGFNLSLSG